MPLVNFCIIKLPLEFKSISAFNTLKLYCSLFQTRTKENFAGLFSDFTQPIKDMLKKFVVGQIWIIHIIDNGLDHCVIKRTYMTFNSNMFISGSIYRSNNQLFSKQQKWMQQTFMLKLRIWPSWTIFITSFAKSCDFPTISEEYCLTFPSTCEIPVSRKWSKLLKRAS